MRGRGGGLVLVLVLLYAAYHFLISPLAKTAHVSRGQVVTKVISFAESKTGAWYCYGGPDDNGCPGSTYDCSGLTQAAFAAAGVSIPRTSEEQWAAGRQVSTPSRGDLVFFTGSSIDPPPGHVGIYLGPHELIDAYATGTQVRVESFGLSSSAPGLQDPTGYTDPG